MSIDDALTAWAASVHLPAETAADIYQRIVATPASPSPAGLDPAWWRRFSADLATRMIASTQLTAWAAAT
jgi:hypothetical protein